MMDSMDQLEIIEDPFNRSDERALINLVSQSIQSHILLAHQKRPELFGLDEEELRKFLGERGAGAVANAIRMKFWFEYDEAQAEHRKMKIKNVYTGICEESLFYQSVLSNPEKVAWIITRPASYDIAMAEMHQFALSRLRKILEIETKFDSKIGALQLKIFELLDMRIKGAIVQKTMNIHASVSSPGQTTEAAKKEEIERRLKELEQYSNKQQGKIINASPVRSK
jgi:hypothetical protein